MPLTLLKNANLDDYAEAQDVLIEDGKIELVGPAGTLPGERADEVLDCNVARLCRGSSRRTCIWTRRCWMSGCPTSPATSKVPSRSPEHSSHGSHGRRHGARTQGPGHGHRARNHVHPNATRRRPNRSHTRRRRHARLREEYRGRIDLQVVAFPQEGIIKAPGTIDLMEECLGTGPMSSVAARTTRPMSTRARTTFVRCSISPRSTACPSTCTVTSRWTSRIRGMRSSSTSPMSPSSEACRVASPSVT